MLAQMDIYEKTSFSNENALACVFTSSSILKIIKGFENYRITSCGFTRLIEDLENKDKEQFFFFLKITDKTLLKRPTRDFINLAEKNELNEQID